MVLVSGSDLRATQVGVGEVGLSEADRGVTVCAYGSERRATQVGVREVGFLEVDGGGVVAIASIGIESRVTHLHSYADWGEGGIPLSRRVRRVTTKPIARDQRTSETIGVWALVLN